MADCTGVCQEEKQLSQMREQGAGHARQPLIDHRETAHEKAMRQCFRIAGH